MSLRACPMPRSMLQELTMPDGTPWCLVLEEPADVIL